MRRTGSLHCVSQRGQWVRDDGWRREEFGGFGNYRDLTVRIVIGTQ